MSEHVDSIKRKPSGSEYRKRKGEKEKEFQKRKKFMNTDKYITTKNQAMNVASTSEIQTNASVVEPLSDKSDQIAVEDIVAEVRRQVVLQLQMLLRMTPLFIYNKYKF